jgi:hypothetical protein
MAANERRKQLSKGIDRLTEENRIYVLGVSEALAFAQEAMDRPEGTSPGGCVQEGERGIQSFFSKE